MEFGWFEIHDAVDELYQDQRQQIWDPVRLMASLRKELGTKNDVISDIEIYEDHHTKHTVVKIVINERRYLMEKMITPTLDLEKEIPLMINYRYTTLNPIVKIKVE